MALADDDGVHVPCVQFLPTPNNPQSTRPCTPRSSTPPHSSRYDLIALNIHIYPLKTDDEPTTPPKTKQPTPHHSTPTTNTQQAALLNRWADLPLEERTAARNYVATLLLAAAPDRYPNFVRAQILQVGFVFWCWLVDLGDFLGGGTLYKIN